MSVRNIPPPIDKSKISPDGTEVEILSMAVTKDITTQLGHVAKALTGTCKIKGQSEEFSFMFSIDKAEIAGSAGRILSKAKVQNVNDLDEKTLKKFSGMMVTIRNKGGKLYWY